MNKILLVLLIGIAQSYAIGQVLSTASPVLPPSPNAAALIQAVEVPVSTYTGVPQVNIPIYTIMDGSISLPIALSYHSQGVKVESIPSWVGEGWSLTGSGVITRTIRGKIDELYPDGVQNAYKFIMGEMSNQEKAIYADCVVKGDCDSEPDQYFFAAPGISGEFAFDENGNPVIIPGQKILITGNVHMGFTLFSPDGTKYIFDFIEQTTSFNANAQIDPETYNSSWYLTSIVYSNGEYVSYDYQSDPLTFISHRSSSVSRVTGIDPYNDCPLISTTTEFKSTTQSVRLKYISTSNLRVDFKAETNRSDLPNNKQLDRIEINARENGVLALQKKFLFTYSNGCRLGLKSMQEVSADGLTLPSYEFTYNSSVPCRTSKSIDHWGYYNNNNTSMLVPRYRKIEGSVLLDYDGADREPSPSRVLSGLIKAIKYPTGGLVEYIFEPHDYGFIQTAPIIEDDKEFYHELFIADGPTSTNVFSYSFNVPFLQPNKTGFTIYIICKDPDNYPISAFAGWLKLINKQTNQTFNMLELKGPSSSPIIDYHDFNKFGDYELQMIIDDPDLYKVHIAFDIQRNNGLIKKSRLGGGARIKEIRYYDTPNSLAKVDRYEYTMQNESDRSSGVIINEPRYHYTEIRGGISCPMGGPDDCHAYTCNYLVRKSGSLSVGNTAGSYVGYREVKVIKSSSEEGYVIQKYTSAYEFQDVSLLSFGYPYAPTTSWDFRRGKLREESVYNANGNCVMRKMLNYDFTGYNKSAALGLTIRKKEINDGGSSIEPDLLFYDIGGYSVLSEWNFIKEEITELYDITNGGVSISTNKFYYDNHNHQQLSRVESLQSDGTSLLIQNFYPLDYTNISIGPIGSMKGDLHMYSTVIESISRIKKPQDQSEKVIGAHFISFLEIDLGWRKVILPSTRYISESSDELSTFTNSLFSGVPSDPTYKLEKSYFYNSKGKMTKVLDRTGLTTSYVWGYENSRIISAVTNAEPSDIFYTSFEFESDGVSSISKTGLLASAKTLAITPPSSNLFHLSYWRKSGASDWELIEQNISAPIIIGGNGLLIDEVRLTPVNALIKTFTYNTGWGITSINDANNIITYYSYDKFGKLEQVRDKNNHLLSTYQYQYKDQQ